MKRVILSAAVLLTALTAASVFAQEPVKVEKKVYINEQLAFDPGYPIGDTALANPEIADFNFTGGRRSIVVVGKATGRTTLTLWDQRGIKRHEINLFVTTREDDPEVRMEELKSLLKDFPNTSVSTVRGQLAITGTVNTEDDKEAIERIAAAAEAQNLVRVVRRGGGAPAGGDAGGGGTQPAFNDSRGSGTEPPPPGAGGGGRSAAVEYDVEIIEANVNFGSGTYQQGIEPSGRPIFKGTIKANPNAEGELWIPGALITPKAGKDDKNASSNKKGAPPAPPTPVGLKVKLRPSEILEDGSFTTYITIETNVPVEGAKDPAIMRRARWEMPLAGKEPFGLGGGELMAMPAVVAGEPKLGKAIAIGGIAAGMPGVSSAGAVGTGLSIGAGTQSLVYYDKEKKTQVFALFHPRVQGAR